MLTPLYSSGMKRLISALILLLAFIVLNPAVRVLANAWAGYDSPDSVINTLGAKDTLAGGINFGGGSDAYVTTPDPPLNFGQTSSGPNGTTWYWTYGFIESGPYKQCFATCAYHPYTSAQDMNGHGFQYNDLNDGLAAGGWYRYKNYFIGSDKWEAQWCDGNGCHVLQDWGLGTSKGMRYEASGGEGADGNTHFGPLTTSQNQWWNIVGGGWSYYCWGTKLYNVPGVLGGCGGNHDWSVHYP